MKTHRNSYKHKTKLPEINNLSPVLNSINTDFKNDLIFMFLQYDIPLNKLSLLHLKKFFNKYNLAAPSQSYAKHKVPEIS